MPRPRVTFSRKGTTSSGPSGPPNDTSSRASYGRMSAGGMVTIVERRPLLSASMLTTYRRILAVPGARLFSATGLVGSAAHVDAGPRHRAAGRGRDRLLRVRRIGGRGRHDRERRGVDPPGPVPRPARAAPGAAGADRDVGGGAGAAHRLGARRVAALDGLRARGRRGADAPARGHLRPRALVARARRAATGADGVRPRVRRRRGGVHRRPDPGDRAGHGLGPGRRPGGGRHRRRRRHALPGVTAGHRAARPRARLDRRRRTADAVAHRGAARGRGAGAGVAVRLGRGDDGGVRRGARRPGPDRGAARLLGARAACWPA